MKVLEQAEGMVSAYRVDSEHKSSQAGIGQEKKPGDGQKLEEYELILDNMQFEQLYDQVRILAPLLCGLLDALMAPNIERKDRPPRDPSKSKHRAAIITSILCYYRASERSNKFPRVFGAFLHSNDVKRRVLDLLRQLGLREGYNGVYKHLETVAEQAKASSPSLSMDID
jgi:hypothetical protein